MSKRRVVIKRKYVNDLRKALIETRNNIKDYEISQIVITPENARTIGNLIGVPWTKIDINEFQQGVTVEMEHGSKFGSQTNVTHDSLIAAARIALAHLYEMPNYYTRLAKMEAGGEQQVKSMAVKYTPKGQLESLRRKVAMWIGKGDVPSNQEFNTTLDQFKKLTTNLRKTFRMYPNFKRPYMDAQKALENAYRAYYFSDTQKHMKEALSNLNRAIAEFNRIRT